MVRESKTVVTSRFYEVHLIEILEYGIETFGYAQAKAYFNSISHHVDMLGVFYTYYPECRHLATKSRMYRNIILDSHLIIYRITDKQIEVLDIIHSASNVSKIRNVRKTRL
ncbi:MAG: type II toxin-antitoxin system RelE/ParE family toxin [Tannerella sp.]|jgi:plasmid stabilization system protein ParE|nr:type II toxin-antitoxin system RelE/ParE family toxin [Tannerella sp.]